MSENTGQFNYMCELCGQGFNSKKQVQEHQNKYEGVSFKCRNCGKEFFTCSKRNNHQKIMFSCSFSSYLSTIGGTVWWCNDVLMCRYHISKLTLFIVCIEQVKE